MLAKLGFKSVEDVKFGMSLNTADGATIEVEREEGEPQVGDKATPDGEFLMPDGTTIVVENGKIVEIKPKTVGEQSEEDDILEQDDDKAEIERLKSEIDDLKAENEKLKQELEDAKKNAKTTDDLRVLNAVKIAGGEKALAKLSSGYVPEGRNKDGKRVEERKEGRVTTEDILARMEKNNKKK
jgi:ATP-dependent Clp protease protease subunit